MSKLIKILVSSIILLSIASCSYRPIFNPNEKYQLVGEKEAQKDANYCLDEAKEYLAASKKRRALKEGVRGIGWGSIFGGIFGFIVGGDSVGLVKGIAYGAAGGAVTGAGGVLAEDTLKPDHLKQKYATNCLARKNYQILGWE